jgi:hypothetical protein
MSIESAITMVIDARVTIQRVEPIGIGERGADIPGHHGRRFGRRLDRDGLFAVVDDDERSIRRYVGIP